MTYKIYTHDEIFIHDMTTLVPKRENMTELPIQNIKATPAHMWKTGVFKVCKLIITSFSTTERRRKHPIMTMTPDGTGTTRKSQHVRLITIGPSHFCEKARWALDILDSDVSSPIFYTENCHPPVFHSMETLQVSKGVVSMVPMVSFQNIISNGKEKMWGKEEQEELILYDSQYIVQHFCPFLYPDSCKDEIIQLETYFGSHVGATARCYLYHVMLSAPKYYPTLSHLVSAQSSTVEKMIWGKLLDKGLADGMRKAMGINEASAQKSLEAVREAFDMVSDRLKCKNGKKKKFLMDKDDDGTEGGGGGVGFTAADLAFASLASIIIMPPELNAFMEVMKDEDLPHELVSLRDELRLTLAGQHVLEMYRNVRGIVVPKVVNRDCLPWGFITMGACVGAGMMYAKL
mmetsp:Transcript_14692/g.27613  ORF Transcript_14692/g.27613 Transcript_14692/m.27613 type:complete len:403 (-) Transcript_14692:4387-5595(-)